MPEEPYKQDPKQSEGEEVPWSPTTAKCKSTAATAQTLKEQCFVHPQPILNFKHPVPKVIEGALPRGALVTDSGPQVPLTTGQPAGFQAFSPFRARPPLNALLDFISKSQTHI